MIIYRVFFLWLDSALETENEKYYHALLKIDNEVYKRLSKGSECFENDARVPYIQ